MSRHCARPNVPCYIPSIRQHTHCVCVGGVCDGSVNWNEYNTVDIDENKFKKL
jgi:hypothetical protein